MQNPNLREIKPDVDMAIKRSEAFWNRDMIDRPLMMGCFKKPDAQMKNEGWYWERCFGELDTILSNVLHNCSQKIYKGESMPGYWTSLGTHEIAQYCGYDVVWPEDKATNWCKHSDKELEELLPLKIDEDNYYWKRSIEVFEKAAEMWQGRVFPMSYDFHSNMDLLLSVRGDANLCMDLYDCPEVVKKGLDDACAIFEKMWKTFVAASKSEEYGYYQFRLYSEKPSTVLACDFSALIGKEMFDEFALPCLNYESEIIGDRVVYHWDGPDALKHVDSLVGIKNFHTLEYTCSPGTRHYQFLDVYQKVQSHGKGIVFGGTPEEIKAASKILKPNLTIYIPEVANVSEFEEIEEWLIKNS